jgi:hypothetical protein
MVITLLNLQFTLKNVAIYTLLSNKKDIFGKDLIPKFYINASIPDLGAQKIFEPTRYR